MKVIISKLNNFIVDTDIIWSIKGYAYIGENKIYEYLCSIDFELNQGFIIGSDEYKENVEKNFFNEKIANKQCFKKEIHLRNYFFDSYYCNENIDFAKFENLVLYISKIKYEIVFTYKDIFEENDEYLFFNIIFIRKYGCNHDFILGKPFFKKYPIVFNVDGIVEKIGFYQNLFIKIKENAEEEKMQNNKYSKWYILKIILIFIGIIIIGILIYMIKKYFKKSKKKKVNELIEFFDYSAKK